MFINNTSLAPTSTLIVCPDVKTIPTLCLGKLCSGDFCVLVSVWTHMSWVHSHAGFQ